MDLSSEVSSIRVVRQGAIPQPLNIVPPGRNPTRVEERSADSIYLEDYLPRNSDHHVELGKFVARWSLLENGVAVLLANLMETENRISFPTFSNMGMRQVIDLIRSLASIQLQEKSIEMLNHLMDRLSVINRKRNAIVHGHWALEVVFGGSAHELKLRVTFAREITPPDRRIEEKLHELKNQKIRSKYIFGLKKIRSASFECAQLSEDIHQFRTTAMAFRSILEIERHRSWQVSKFLKSLSPDSVQIQSVHFSHHLANPEGSNEP